MAERRPTAPEARRSTRDASSVSGEMAVERVHGALQPVARDTLASSCTTVAVRLLGTILVRELADGGSILARVVETEAYHERDPASHSHARRTARSEPMFWRPGTAYVYRSYGVHWCLNVTVEPEEVGAAVLLRAAVVLAGEPHVRHRRPDVGPRAGLLRGPGCLTAGIGVSGEQDRSDLISGSAGLRLMGDGLSVPSTRISSGPRVGVRLGADRAWRWWMSDRPEVSRYRRSPRAAPPGANR